jgi:hypothetical protein
MRPLSDGLPQNSNIQLKDLDHVQVNIIMDWRQK